MRAYRKLDDGFEFKVEGGRLVLLGIGGFLTLVLVFLVGVLVGKGLWGGSSGMTEPIVQAAGRPEPKPVEAATLSFYTDLQRPDTGKPPVLPRDPATAGAASETPIPAPEPATEPVSVAAPPPEVPVKASEPARISPAADAGKAAPPRESAAPEKPKLVAPPPEPKPDVRLPAPLFTVQVGSFKDRASADQQVHRIAAQGVTAQVVQVPVEGRTWYRVQVGRFNTRAEAESHYQKKLRPKGVQGFVTTR